LPRRGRRRFLSTYAAGNAEIAAALGGGEVRNDPAQLKMWVALAVDWPRT
jgi:hypothetical protein